MPCSQMGALGHNGLIEKGENCEKPKKFYPCFPFRENVAENQDYKNRGLKKHDKSYLSKSVLFYGLTPTKNSTWYSGLNLSS